MGNRLSDGSAREYRVLGVDACKKGWIGLSNDGRGYFGSNISVLIASALEPVKKVVGASG